MQYRDAGGARNLRDIARALGWRISWKGSVRRVGNRVLVSVQLIDASSDRHIWAERYDRTIVDSIGLQGELATEIARVLKAKLAPEEKTSLGTRPTSNPEAYVALSSCSRLRGKLLTVHPPITTRTLDQLYAQTIALDPTFALAQARASITYSNNSWQTRDPALKAKARTLADEALRLSPTLGEAHLALGLYFDLTEEDYAAALEAIHDRLDCVAQQRRGPAKSSRGFTAGTVAGARRLQALPQLGRLDPLVEPFRLGIYLLDGA